jgi:MarR family transcriptional regulator, transcriptional regulator for hemolysin
MVRCQIISDLTKSQPVLRQFVFTAKAIREAFEDALVEAGGSLGTWVVLSAVSDHGIVSQSALATQAHLEGATMTHHVDRLEKLGLVRRVSDPADRRVRRIELTPEGERLHSTLLDAARRFEAAVLAGVSRSRQEELRRTLDTLDSNLASLSRTPSPSRSPE